MGEDWLDTGTVAKEQTVLWKIENKEALMSFKMESDIPKEGGSQGNIVA